MNRICGVSGKDVRDPQTYAIIGAAMEVHRNLGSEFLAPAYQAALEVEFGIRDVPHDREVDMPIHYKGVPLGVRYRADFVCFGAILVELKAMDRISTREEAQIINYLAASGIGRGILLNFGTASLQFKRFVGSAYLTLSNASSVKPVGPRS
jgi:GxxExxY protein